jgi:hypothetical protein
MTVTEVYQRIKTRSEIARYFCPDTGTFIENPWKLFAPADKDLILAFEKKGFSLPEDLRTLLLLTNAIEYRWAEQRLYSIEDMIALADVFKGIHKPGIYTIGYFWQDWILIDSALCNTDAYLFYVPDVCKMGYTFGYGFPLFLERLMYCEFTNFWQWVQNPQEEKAYLMP